MTGETGKTSSGSDLDSPDLDMAIADVYRGSLEEFVGRRDALVKELRAADRRDDANTVKGLRKPTRTAWALDAAVLDDPATVEQVAAAVADAIEAQSGGGDLRGAFDQLRTAVRDLAAAAATAAAGDGHPVDQAALVPAVSAVIGDADAFDALRAGRLATIPTAGGLDLLTGIPLPATPPSPALRPATRAKGATGTAGPTSTGRTGTGESAPARTPEDAEAAREAEAVEAARAARQALQQAEAEAATARRRSTEAERALRKAEINAEAAEEQLRLADQKAQAMRSKLHQARQQAEAATAREHEATEAVGRIRSELDQLTR